MINFDKFDAFLSGAVIMAVLVIGFILILAPNSFTSPNGLFTVAGAEKDGNMIEYELTPIGGDGHFHLSSFGKYVVGDTLRIGSK